MTRRALLRYAGIAVAALSCFGKKVLAFAKPDIAARIDDGAWHHICLAWDKVTATERQMVDGRVVDRIIGLERAPDWILARWKREDAGTIIFNCRDTSAGGDVSRVAIYDIAIARDPLPVEKISGHEEGLVALYSLDEGIAWRNGLVVSAENENAVLRYAYVKEHAPQLLEPGISLTPEQEALIRGALASDREVEAQRVILGELDRQFGGSA